MKKYKKYLNFSFLALLVLLNYSSNFAMGMKTSANMGSGTATDPFIFDDEHAGLINQGNTCFMNAALQVLTNIQPFTDILDQSPQPRTELTTYFIELKDKLLQETNPINTSIFIDAANNAKILSIQAYKKTLHLNRRTNQIEEKSCNQQDAAEFLTQFLDKICQENAALLDLFSFNQESHVICKKCIKNEPQNIRWSTILLLTIPFPKTQNMSLTLNDLFEKYTEKEIVPDYNCWRHNPTEDPTKTCSAIKYNKITTTSEVLIIGLNRFEYNKKAIKNSTPIQIPLNNLEITKLGNTQKTKYDLIGFVCHIGPSAGSGHYTSHIKDYRNNNWYFCDDEKVTLQTPQQVEQAILNTLSTPYILFYQRQTPSQVTTPDVEMANVAPSQATPTSVPQVQPQPQTIYQKTVNLFTKFFRGKKRKREETESSLTPPDQHKKLNKNN